MRKSLNEKLLVTFALLLFVAACGGGPTAPSASSRNQNQSQWVTPVPSPSPTPTPPPTVEPAPVPAPIPTPEPIPAPTPKPVTYIAATDTAHWFGQEVVPTRFEVSWNGDTLRFGPVSATIHAQDEHGIFAVMPGSNATNYSRIQIDLDGDQGAWTFSGPAGQASGRMVRSGSSP